MATDNLAAGVHTSTTPSILLAKDLYAEKLRSMNLERQLSSSRVALRRSQQNERDLKLSAVRKRSQHSKSVWKILDQASKQTLRNPPLALANSVPNLLNTRDPISLLRRAKPILSLTNTNDEASEEDLLLLPKYVPQQNHTKRTGSTFKKNKRTKAAAASSRRRRRKAACGPSCASPSRTRTARRCAECALRHPPGGGWCAAATQRSPFSDTDTTRGNHMDSVVFI